MYYADWFEIEGQEILLQDRELREAIELDKNNKNKIVVNVLKPPKDIQPADNTGENDSTESINACIEFAANNNGVVFIPNGKYLVSTLVVKNNTTIIGCGCYSTNVIQKGASAKAIITSGSGANNVSVIGVGFDGNDEVQVNDLNGVEISGDNFSMYGCYFTKSSTIIKGTFGGHNTIKNCVFDFCAKKFISISNSGQFNIENAIFNSISDTAPECCVETSGGNCFITECSSYASAPIAFKISGDNNVVVCTVKNAAKDFEGSGKNLVVINGKTISVGYDVTVNNFECNNNAVKGKASVNELEVTGDTNIKYSEPYEFKEGISAVKMTSKRGVEYNLLVVDENTNFGSYISAKSFGAKGDGITDDTSAIQTWVDYISDNHKTGFLPAGTYLITAQINIKNKNSFKIIGEGECAATLKSNGGEISILTFNTVEDFTIESVAFDMNQDKTVTRGHAIYIVDSNGITIRNVNIKNVGGGAIMAYPSVNTKYISDLTIDNVLVEGIGVGNDGIHPTGILVANGKRNIITKCKVYNVGYYAIEFKNFSQNCCVSDCVCEYCKQAFYLGGDADTNVSDHYCRRISFSNIIALDCREVFTIGKARDITVVGASFKVTNPGKWDLNYGVSARNCFRVDMSGCNIDHNGNTSGIDLRNCNNIVIGDTNVYRISGNGRAYSFTESANCTISVRTSHDPTVILDTDNIVIADYKATRKQIYGGANKIVIESNQAGNRINYTFANGSGYLDATGWHNA